MNWTNEQLISTLYNVKSLISEAIRRGWDGSAPLPMTLMWGSSVTGGTCVRKIVYTHSSPPPAGSTDSTLFLRLSNTRGADIVSGIYANTRLYGTLLRIDSSGQYTSAFEHIGDYF